MNPAPPQPATPAEPKSKKRRGVVLVAVLVVVASLSLAGYHYNDMMVSEYKASENAHRSVQARSFAVSGIHYAAAMLSSPDNYNGTLGGNPWNNPQAFQGISVKGDNNLQGYFTIIAPADIDDAANQINPNFGVTDESSKINLNAVMKSDTTGKTAHNMLVKLPFMTEEIANSIVAWMGGSYGLQNGGASDDFYMSQAPKYRSKNGPIDSIDELLLVKGVTRDLLYGSDLNRNGTFEQDKNESGLNGFDRGWSAYLTVHSREPNSDSQGRPYVFLNNPDLTQLYTSLSEGGISDDMAKYIIMYRQNQRSASTGPLVAFALKQGAKKGAIGDYPFKLTDPATTPINSLFDLVDTYVSINTKGKDAKGKTITITTLYDCPLNDVGQMRDQMPKLFALATVFDPTTNPEIPARININTAPRAVLAAIPELDDSDVEKIIATRPAKSTTEAPPEIFASPTWLRTEALLPADKLKKLDKYLTTRTQVYRVQSVGYFEGKGPAIRIEAVIDTNAGRPRIIDWRDLSELGKGWNSP